MMRRPPRSTRTDTLFPYTTLFRSLLPITLLLIGLLTGTVAWFFLKMPAAAYDPLTLPGFFWYYRHDPVVTEALWRGAVIGVPLPVLLMAIVLRPKKNLHGEARFAREGEIDRKSTRLNSSH